MPEKAPYLPRRALYLPEKAQLKATAKGLKALSSSKQRDIKPSAKHKIGTDQDTPFPHPAHRQMSPEEIAANWLCWARTRNFLFIHQPPRGGIKMRDWRIERCALREKVRKGLFQKNRAWGPSDVRITNKKRVGNNTRRNWLLMHQEVSRLCNTSECCVFYFVSILALSQSECVSMCLGCLPFFSFVESRCAMFSHRLNTQ